MVPLCLHVMATLNPAGADLNDLYVLDPQQASNIAWTDLSNSVKGDIPSARAHHGFTSENGKLYVFAGSNQNHGAGVKMIYTASSQIAPIQI